MSMPRSARRCAAAGCSRSAPRALDGLAEQDWVPSTQRQFEPIRAGERLWIVPTWREPPDPGAINIFIDPGAAFGTGSHPTTRLCSPGSTRSLRGGETVIDYGCGSGILAIAAMKLGAARATGVDIDPLALLAARCNAAQNAVARSSCRRRRPSSRPTSLVANILANPLMLLAPALAHSAPRRAHRALGHSRAQAAEVAGVYRAAFALEPPREDDGWVLIAGVRR